MLFDGASGSAYLQPAVRLVRRPVVWLVVACAVLLVAAGGMYLARHDGGHGATHHGPSVLGETVTSAMGRWSWHFPALPPRERSSSLLLINPNRSAVSVWVRFDRSSASVFHRVRVPPADARAVRRSPAAAGVMDGAVTLQASKSIVPFRMVRAGGELRSVMGKPAAGNPRAGQVPMPARVWRFGPVGTSNVAVVLTLFNPGTAPVDADVRLSADPRHIQARVPAQRSVEVSLSSASPQGATGALRIRATGDIIPERVALGDRSARFGYGTSEQGGT